MLLSAAEVRDLAPLPSGVELPAETPAAPWTCRVEALVWWHRAVPAAGEAALAGFGSALAGRRLIWMTVGAFVRYLGSPVGTYSEFFASPVLVAARGGLPAATVPVIAVDSVPSIHGGRAHWGLPKVLGSFGFPPLVAGAEVGVETADWSVSATLSGARVGLPFAAVLPTLQPQPSGEVAAGRVLGGGLAALGRVEVEAGGTVAPWLLPGRHRCVRVTSGRMNVGAPVLLPRGRSSLG